MVQCKAYSNIFNCLGMKQECDRWTDFIIIANAVLKYIVWPKITFNAYFHPRLSQIIAISMCHRNQGLNSVNILCFHLSDRWCSGQQRKPWQCLNVCISLQLKQSHITDMCHIYIHTHSMSCYSICQSSLFLHSSKVRQVQSESLIWKRRLASSSSLTNPPA